MGIPNGAGKPEWIPYSPQRGGMRPWYVQSQPDEWTTVGVDRRRRWSPGCRGSAEDLGKGHSKWKNWNWPWMTAWKR